MLINCWGEKIDMQTLSCCYFPTTVFFIEDSQSFLENISLKLDRNLIYDLFTNPELALQDLKKRTTVNAISQFLFKQLSDDENNADQAGHYLMHMDLSSNYQQIYNPQRFSYVSVAVVDYSMPQMDGIEFCRRLADPAIKKIMLTGEADHHIAVNAFNEGLIDKFIIKDSPNMLGELNTAIAQFQAAYFQSLSKSIINAMTAKTTSPLIDGDFIQFFTKLCKDTNATEYYLLDASGSFLLMDAEAKPTWLLVKTDQEIQEYCDIAIGNHAPHAIVEALQKREKLPFFLTEMDYQTPVTAWAALLHPAKLLANKYFYAVVNDKVSKNFRTSGIESLKMFLTCDSAA
jgi:CheY-like chemotaxis protein